MFEGPRFGLQGVGGVGNGPRQVADFGAAGAGEWLGAFRGKETLGGPPDLAEGPDFTVHQTGGDGGSQRPAEQGGEDEGSSQFSASVGRRLRGQHDSDYEHGGQHSGHRPEGGAGAQTSARPHYPTNR